MVGNHGAQFYRPTLGDIAISGINFPPAILFYIVYPVGLFIFSINPALKSGSITTAIIYGALFGFFTYATYDLTNHATLRNWTTQLTMIDVAWGTFLLRCVRCWLFGGEQTGWRWLMSAQFQLCFSLFALS